MKNKHSVILKEITNELELSLVTGGSDKQGGNGQNTGGSKDWGTGAQVVWGTAVSAITGKNCSYPGGFYGPGNATPTGSGTCTGGMAGRGRGK